jgi:signal transduction histidine kinase
MEQLDQAIAETRTMSYLLHPPLLDETGLKSAITWYAEGFAKRSGIEVTVDIAPGLGRLERDVETALFRVLQECLTNIHRHSGSESASIHLSRDSGEVRLEVRDRGKGLPTSTSVASGPAVGIGIQGIRERMRQLGGRMQLVSKVGTGTTVIVAVPESARVSVVADMFETEAR